MKKIGSCTVGFLPTEDPEARLCSADIISYLVGCSDLSNTRALALLGDPDASAYERIFSFRLLKEDQFPDLVLPGCCGYRLGQSRFI